MKIVRTLTKFLIITIFVSLIFTIQVKANDTTINRWNIQLSIEEIEILCRIVQLEAGGEITESKYATTETILNRMTSEKYPNTLIEVLAQKGQFGTWKNVTATKATPTLDTYQAVFMVLIGQTNVLPLDNLHFNNQPIGKEPIKIGKQYYGK